MIKQELCQTLRMQIMHMYNDIEISNICNYIWFELSKNHEVIKYSLNDYLKSDAYKAILSGLLAKMPIQYIVSSSDFMGLDLYVTPDVLIPRAETETLVQWILDDIPTIYPIQAIDIGTGSACIALALKKFRPDWKLFAMDISQEALSIAKHNSIKLGLEISLIHADLFNFDTNLLQSCNLIVSNPPYIAKNEMDQMDSQVLLYEPKLALFPKGDDPLVFYRWIADYAKCKLKTPFWIYLEMNALQWKNIEKIFLDAQFEDVVIKQDLESMNRMIRIRKID